MRLLDALKLRLRSFLHGTAVEHDLDDELRFHREREIDRHQRRLVIVTISLAMQYPRID